MIRRLIARWRRYREAREAWRRGWMDSPCDGCEGALEAPSYVITARGSVLLVCPSCCQEFRAAGAQVQAVLT